MKRQRIFVSAIAVILSAFSAQGRSGIFNIDDGAYHLVNDNTHQNDEIWLDQITANDPGTHLELTNGGLIDILWGFNKSTITISGGSIHGDLRLYDNSKATISGGILGDDIWAQDNSKVVFSGGNLSEDFAALDNSIIFLYGYNFSVGGQNLSYGDSLLDYATFNGTFFTGTILGTLQDGSALNNVFLIEPSGADIIITPLPSAIILGSLGLTFSGWMLKRKRMV